MRAVLVLAAHELRLRVRDRIGLFWMLGFPLLIAMLFVAIGGAFESRVASIPVVLVASSDTPAAAALAEAIRASDALEVELGSLEDAREKVRHGDAAAYVRVAEAATPAGVRLELGADPARRSEAAIVRTVLALAATKGPSVPIATVPIAPERIGPRSAFDVAFPAAVIWGVLGCTATFALAIAAERARGTWQRLRAAPVSRAEILIGKSLACVATVVVVTAILLAIAVLGFGLRIGNAAALAFAVPSVAVAFAGIAVLVSVLGRTENAVAGAGWSFNLVMAMFGGAMLPLSAMPAWMARIGDASPVKWSILAIEGAVWRDFGAGEMLVPCALLIGVGVAAHAIAIILAGRLDASERSRGPSSESAVRASDRSPRAT